MTRQPRFSPFRHGQLVWVRSVDVIPWVGEYRQLMSEKDFLAQFEAECLDVRSLLRYRWAVVDILGTPEQWCVPLCTLRPYLDEDHSAKPRPKPRHRRQLFTLEDKIRAHGMGIAIRKGNFQ